MLSAKDRKLVERNIPEWRGRTRKLGPDTGVMMLGAELQRLIEAAREEGREEYRNADYLNHPVVF